MALKKVLLRSSIVLLALTLGACVTDVQHYADVPHAQLINANEPIKAIRIDLSTSGRKDFAGNTQFDQGKLLANVKRVLTAENLYGTAGGDTLEIQITAIRVRSTFNAVMWGFMAGSDNLRGDVYLRDSSGKLLNHFSVYAGNALGGIAAGAMSVRWNWLYNKFAELVAKNLTN